VIGNFEIDRELRLEVKGIQIVPLLIAQRLDNVKVGLASNAIFPRELARRLAL